MPSDHRVETTLSPRLVSGVNAIGLWTLTRKEVGRFLNVYTQTLVAPAVTTMLFFAVFALAWGGAERTVEGIPLLAFLPPGLIMMAMAQNAFANTSSSIMISKVQGNIVDVLMPPLTPTEMFLGFMAGGVIRGLMVGLVTGLVMMFFAPVHISSVPVIILFALLGSMLMASIGVAAGIWSEKFDHIAAVTNFFVTPLTFLSGTFYTVNSLPEPWGAIAHYNPFFYMIDGFRSGFIGHADGDIAFGVGLLAAMNVVLGGLSLWMLKTGYKIKS